MDVYLWVYISSKVHLVGLWPPANTRKMKNVLKYGHTYVHYFRKCSAAFTALISTQRLSVDSSGVQPYTSRPKCRKREQHFTAARNCSVPSTVPMLKELTSTLPYGITWRSWASSVGPTPVTKYGPKCGTATQRRFSLHSHLIQKFL